MTRAALTTAAIVADPDFQKLVRKRTRLSICLTALVFALYFGFILLVAFAPNVLGQSIFGGATTLGIPLGVGIIVGSFVLTGAYVVRANTEFDLLNEKLLERYK